MIIGILAGCMVMIGDMLLGWGVHDPGKAGLEGLCYFAIYGLIASGSMHRSQPLQKG